MPVIACCATPLHYCGSVFPHPFIRVQMWQIAALCHLCPAVLQISPRRLVPYVMPDVSHSTHFIVRVETQQQYPPALLLGCVNFAHMPRTDLNEVMLQVLPS